MRTPSYALEMKRRWVANGLPDYPLWIPLLLESGAVLTAIVAVAQRGWDDAPLAALLVLVAVVPWTVELRGNVAPWWAFVLFTGGATATLMTVLPVEYDFTPFLLTLAVGHVTATVGAWRGLPVLVAAIAIVVGLGVAGTLPVAGSAIWAAASMGALDMGYVLRAQQLRIEAQAREYAERARQAATDERQRIAREVHDLVAHSLSVTMLHLTAARRDLEEGGDVDDAVDALRMAERVGRQAVSDVRRTVGLLGRSAGSEPPMPTVADIPALVQGLRAAGMDIHLTMTGDLDQVPPATGLGLYRIVQESLANVAKHCPDAAASVLLDVESDPGTLTIRNPVPADMTRGGEDGFGVRGMTERASQLGASLVSERRGDEWVVMAELPRGDTVRDSGGHVCPLPKLSRVLRRPVVETQ